MAEKDGNTNKKHAPQSSLLRYMSSQNKKLKKGPDLDATDFQTAIEREEEMVFEIEHDTGQKTNKFNDDQHADEEILDFQTTVAHAEEDKQSTEATVTSLREAKDREPGGEAEKQTQSVRFKEALQPVISPTSDRQLQVSQSPTEAIPAQTRMEVMETQEMTAHGMMETHPTPTLNRGITGHQNITEDSRQETQGTGMDESPSPPTTHRSPAINVYASPTVVMQSPQNHYIHQVAGTIQNSGKKVVNPYAKKTRTPSDNYEPPRAHEDPKALAFQTGNLQGPRTPGMIGGVTSNYLQAAAHRPIRRAQNGTDIVNSLLKVAPRRFAISTYMAERDVQKRKRLIMEVLDTTMSIIRSVKVNNIRVSVKMVMIRAKTTATKASSIPDADWKKYFWNHSPLTRPPENNKYKSYFHVILALNHPWSSIQYQVHTKLLQSGITCEYPSIPQGSEHMVGILYPPSAAVDKTELIM